MKKIIFTLFAIAISAILFTANSYAFSYQYAKHSLVTNTSQTINETVFAASPSILEESTINGDYYCAGQNVTIDGTINGDVLCAAQTITINGTVLGNVRMIGQNIVINGSISQDASILAQSLTISRKGIVGRDFSALAQTMQIDGTIERDAQALIGQNILINGTIGRDLQIRTQGTITLSSSAAIRGDFSYISPHAATTSPQTAISGTTSHQLPPKPKQASSAGTTLLSFVYWLIASLVIGIGLILLIPRSMEEMTASMLHNPWHALGWGSVVLIMTPIIALLLMITLIGIPVALILLVVWGICLFISRILAAFAVGHFLLTQYRKRSDETPYLKLCLGVIVAWIVFEIPIIGGILSLLAVLAGLGVIWQYAVSIKQHTASKSI